MTFGLWVLIGLLAFGVDAVWSRAWREPSKQAKEPLYEPPGWFTIAMLTAYVLGGPITFGCVVGMHLYKKDK